MTGYSGTPLVKKLGIKVDFRLYAKNPPENYEDLISPLPENVQIFGRLTNELDMVHFFTTSRAELAGNIEKLMKRIKQDGMIWVSWPKKASKVPTDVTEDVIREIILPLGLVDIKVCAVDATWSGLKLVIRKENRR
ncbi:MAG: DUF3052 domain-containing protein [Ardenticatenaceae bacterium]|nr:MAG: DUF3052 domain-containing protein [Ardenticatenaceae bacterium]